MTTIRSILAEALMESPRARPECSEFPFEGQCEVQGIRIDIENKIGSVRKGVDANGKPWSVILHAHYGEIRNSKGTDDDKLDVYVGPDTDSPWVFVVHQLHPKGSPKAGTYDEDKCLIGWNTPDAAIQAYCDHYDCDSFFGSMTMLPIERFKAWLRRPAARGEPAQPPVSWKPRGNQPHPGLPDYGGKSGRRGPRP